MRITQPGFYKTRDGRKVHVVHVRTDTDWEYPITGWIEGVSGYDNWTADGRLYFNGQNGNADLIAEWTEPMCGTYWLNILSKGRPVAYVSREMADQMAQANRIACVAVNWTEGDGLDR